MGKLGDRLQEGRNGDGRERIGPQRRGCGGGDHVERKIERAGHQAHGQDRLLGERRRRPGVYGLGPVPAVKKALKRAGLTLDKIDMVELNEAFASQAISNIRELKLDMARTNMHGGGISIGHPIGCTGARLIGRSCTRCHGSASKYGLATMCIGGGQGMAMVVEREA